MFRKKILNWFAIARKVCGWQSFIQKLENYKIDPVHGKRNGNCGLLLTEIAIWLPHGKLLAIIKEATSPD